VYICLFTIKYLDQLKTRVSGDSRIQCLFPAANHQFWPFMLINEIAYWFPALSLSIYIYTYIEFIQGQYQYRVEKGKHLHWRRSGNFMTKFEYFTNIILCCRWYKNEDISFRTSLRTDSTAGHIDTDWGKCINVLSHMLSVLLIVIINSAIINNL